MAKDTSVPSVSKNTSSSLDKPRLDLFIHTWIISRRTQLGDT